MDEKRNFISQPCSETLDDNFSSTALGGQEIIATNVLDCASSGEQISLVSVNSDNIAMVEGKDSVIMINPQMTTVIESQHTQSESNPAFKIVSEPVNSSCHQPNSYEETDSVNSNYYVLVEGSDGSQVISRVIPRILPDASEEPQLALNAVLQSEISYIDNNALNESKDQTNFPSDSVTMIIDPTLPIQESQKIFIEPSLANINTQNISAEQLNIGSDHTLDHGLPQIVVVDNSLSPGYQNVQISSQKKDISTGPQIRIADVSNWASKDGQVVERPLDMISVQAKEVEKQLKEEQRQLNLRLLEQSHREHQEKLLHRRNNDTDRDFLKRDDSSEKMLRELGIDDDTPIFSHISAKINPDLLLHVPGCQQFLLNEAGRKTTSAGVTFSSDLDCSFTGDINDFVSLHTMIKSLLKLLSPTNIIFEKRKEKFRTENKTVGCNLLVPYVSSKGRLCKQSSKLIQTGEMLNLEEYLSGSELSDEKGHLKRQKRGYKKRKVFSKNKNKTPPDIDFALTTVEGDTGLSYLYTVTNDIEHNEYSQPLSENMNSLEGSACNEYADAAMEPDLNDPVQRRLLEEQIKCKEIYDENNRLRQMKTDLIFQRHDVMQDAKEAIDSQSDGNNRTRRSTKGRPPKKFDPSETLGKVRPRNPLTESLETKKRRKYEENVSFKYFCDQCSFKTKRRSHFDHHIAYHEKGTDVKHFCPHCDFISISLPALKQHQLLHKKNVLKCPLCNVYVTDKKNLMQKHMRMKHSWKTTAPTDKTFSCDLCSATFTSKMVLSRHKSSHLKSQLGQASEGSLTNDCPHCKKTFGNKIHLHRHLKDVHGPQTRPHLCDQCGRSFKRKDALQQHRIVHIAKSARVLPFKCNKCDKAFRSQAHLKEHSSIHTSDRPFLCQYCGASFKTQPVQKKHILTLHIQPRTHVCGVCCRQFNTKNALQRHENTHKSREPTSADDGMRQWESGVIDSEEMKKMGSKEGTGNLPEVSTNGLIVSLEEDQTRTALVMKTDSGAQVMVDPSLVPAMMAPNDAHSNSEGTRSLEVPQALIQTGQGDQAFYYLADDNL